MWKAKQAKVSPLIGFETGNPGVESSLACHDLAVVPRIVLHGDHAGPFQVLRPEASVGFRRLSGIIVVHITLIKAKHTALDPLLPASRQPGAFSRSIGQIEYCSS